MTWQKAPEPEEWVTSAVRRARKARIYADEDIEDEVVEWLRSRKVNIKSARELGHRGKPDHWQAEFARKNRRFLLTKNSRDFLNDSKYPWHRGYSFIVLDGDMSKIDDFQLVLLHLLHLIVPTGEFQEGSKITVRPGRLTQHFRGEDGQIVTNRWRLTSAGIELWSEE